MVPAFAEVTRRKHSTIKTSALFTYVSKMPAALKLGALKSKLIADGNAYLLTFKEAIDSTAFELFAEEGYKFDPANPPHIRFDREYGNPGSSIYRNKFFAHWHYTERLVRESDSSTVVVHYYFHRSMLLDIIVTRADSTKYTLDLATKAKLEKNTERALVVMASLFKDLDKYKEELNEKFEALTAQTSTNSYLKKTEIAVMRSHLQKLQEMSVAINELEEDFIDCRFDIIRKRLELCIAKKLEVQVTPKPPKYDSDEDTQPTTEAKMASTTTQSEAVATAVKTEEVPAKSLEELLKDTNNLVLAYQSAAAADLVVLDTRRQELLNQLLMDYFACNDDASKKAIEEMQRKLVALQSLPDYLLMYMLNGDSDNFITLYAIAGLKITPQNFAKYISTFVSDEFARREADHIKICEYLYANASEYALFLEFVTAVSNVIEGNIRDEQAVLCSLPFMLVNHNLYDFFCMLIVHGRNPNIHGLTVGKHTMSLLLSLIPIRNSERYMDFLLAQGAQSEGMYYSSSYRTISQLPEGHKYSVLSLISTGAGAQEQDSEHQISCYRLNIDLAKSHSCLASSLLCYYVPDEITQKFALRAGLYEVAYATALYLSCAVRSGKVHAKFADMRCYSTNQAKNEDLQKIYAEIASPCNHFVLGYYFDRPDQQHKAQLAIDIFKARVAAASEPELKAVIERLADRMLQHKKIRDWPQAAIISEATFYCVNYLSPTYKSHNFINWLLGQMQHIQNSLFVATREARYRDIAQTLQDFTETFIAVSQFSKELTDQLAAAKVRLR